MKWLNVLAICSTLLFSAASGTASAAESMFDVEAVKAKYSIRDYAYAPLPERGYNYYKIAENALVVASYDLALVRTRLYSKPLIAGSRGAIG